MTVLRVSHSFAFDLKGNRTPENDDVSSEDISWMAHLGDAEITTYAKARYPKAVRIQCIFMISADVIIPVTTGSETAYMMAVMSLRTCHASTKANIWAYINNSPDDALRARLVNQCHMLGINVVMWPGPFNIAKIFNDGFDRSKGDYIGFGTSDVIYYDHWLENIIELWEENPEYFILSSWSFDDLATPCARNHIVNRREIVHTGNPSAGVLVFKRSSQYRWDENFELWEIDADLFYHIERNKLKAGICLNARCDHFIEGVRRFVPHGPKPEVEPTLYLRKKWNLVVT